jgi:hypothetical protein
VGVLTVSNVFCWSRVLHFKQCMWKDVDDIVCRILAVEARVQCQCDSYEIYGDERAWGRFVFQYLGFPLPIIIPSVSHTHVLSGDGAVPVSPVSPHARISKRSPVTHSYCCAVKGSKEKESMN